MMNYLGLGVRILYLVLLWMITIFLIWRKFRLDIEEHQILAFGLWTLIFTVWIGFYLRIWIGIIAIIIILGIFSTQNNWDGFEVADYLFPFLMFYIGLANAEWFMFVIAIWGWIVTTNFRKLHWYKSGKPGLGALAMMFVLGAYLVIYGFRTNFADQVAGIWVLTGSMVGIYLRSKLKLVK